MLLKDINTEAYRIKEMMERREESQRAVVHRTCGLRSPLQERICLMTELITSCSYLHSANGFGWAGIPGEPGKRNRAKAEILSNEINTGMS